MTILELLKLAKNKIQDPKHFTNEDFAVDATGVWVAPTSAKAVKFSDQGSILHFAKTDTDGAFKLTNSALERLETAYGCLTHKMALQAFDFAIALECLEKEVSDGHN